MAILDVLTAFATVAANHSYVRPELLPSESGVLSLKRLRHPCLEIQEGVNYVPNDVEMKRGKIPINLNKIKILTILFIYTVYTSADKKR